MPQFKLYHNPRFLAYARDRDDDHLVIPAQPVAVFDLPAGERQSLETVFRLTQHLDRAWFARPVPQMTVCLRSTSVGDVVESPGGGRFVVETAGFRRLDSDPPAPLAHLVWDAYRLLEEALGAGPAGQSEQLQRACSLLSQAIAQLTGDSHGQDLDQ